MDTPSVSRPGFTSSQIDLAVEEYLTSDDNISARDLVIEMLATADVTADEDAIDRALQSYLETDDEDPRAIAVKVLNATL